MPFSEQLKINQELNNLYSKISKFSFVIPNYIATSPNELYNGSWNISKRYHGHGIKYQFNNKKNYKGEFKNGKYDGIGKEYCLDGSYFEGFFQMVLKNMELMNLKLVVNIKVNF